MALSRRKRWALGIAVAVVAGTLGYAYACSIDRTYVAPGHFSEPVGSNLGLGLPKSLKEIRSSVDFGVPEVPPVTLEEPCTRKTKRVTLVQAFGRLDGVLQYYSHELTLMVHPRGEISRQQHIRNWRGGRAGQVRGQLAQISFLGDTTTFSFCISNSTCTESVIGENGVRYHNVDRASIEWMEDREQIRLTGPYPHQLLIRLADQFRFDSS